MISVNDDPGAIRPGQRRQTVNTIKDRATVEEDLACKNQIVTASLRRCQHVCRRHHVQHDVSTFNPPRHLSAKAVEFAVRGKDPSRPPGQR